ncbi:MAG: hypothetical protein ACO1OB_05775 [Archangium sp.]
MRPSMQMGRGHFRLPPIKNVSTALAIAIVVTSVIWKISQNVVVLYLVPGLVWSGEVWQLVTWIPAEAPQTGSVLFSALIVWMTGGSLEMMCGRARFLRFMLGVTFVSGVLTALLGFVLTPLQGIPFFGGGVLAAIAWVGYGCACWSQQLNFWGIPLSGKGFALLGVAIASLNAIFTSPYLLVAEAWALLLTFAVARWGFPGSLLERFGSWRLQRTLDKRSSHLKSIDGGKRNVGGDSDKYLH